MGHQGVDGRVLHPGGGDVALVGKSGQGRADGGVVALAAATGEDDLLRGGAQEGRHLLPGLPDPPAHLPSEGVHAGGIAVELVVVREHRFQDGRIHLGGGVVVQVNDSHGATSSTRSSGVTSSLSLASTKSFRVSWAAAQEAQVPRVATKTRSPTTSMSSRSPPSCCRAGRISSTWWATGFWWPPGEP